MLSFAIALSLCSGPAWRDHGPGTSGGGLTTVSGETLRPGSVSLSVRIDYTQFERLSSADIQERTLEVSGDHAHFDAVRWTLLETFEVAFGAAEGLQLAWSFGYYRGNDLREGHIHGDGSYGFHELGDVSGMTDHWFTAKGRLLKGPGGSLAVFGGVKLPFGEDDEVGEDGSRNAALEASLQPGSGAFDAQLGVAYSRWLAENLTLDASFSYTLRGEDDHFKIGDLVLLGVAFGWRFTETVRDFPQPSLFLEAHVRHLFRNEEDGERIRNSGGTVLFLGPGFRLGFSERVSWTIAVQIPAVQVLHDEQQETLFKATMGLTFTF